QEQQRSLQQALVMQKGNQEGMRGDRPVGGSAEVKGSRAEGIVIDAHILARRQDADEAAAEPIQGFEQPAVVLEGAQQILRDIGQLPGGVEAVESIAEDYDPLAIRLGFGKLAFRI